MRGRKDLNTNNNENNAINFIISQNIAKINTNILVEVLKVYDDYVDVKPLINLLDGENNGVEHSTIHKIPFFTYQSGSNAVVITPEIGDYGLCAISKNDISKLKNSKQRSNPNTRRQFSISDGLYLGSFIKKSTPTNFVEIKDGQIDIQGTGDININCSNATVNATTKATINSPAIELGENAVQGIARIGDEVAVEVTSGSSAGTYTGTITTGSIISKSL